MPDMWRRMSKDSGTGTSRGALDTAGRDDVWVMAPEGTRLLADCQQQFRLCQTGQVTSEPAVATVPRARRLAPDERREEIIAAAARLFEQRPWSQVSTVDIAREAGIARGLLNHYFGDKRGLYLAVVRRWLLVPAPQVVPEDLPTALPDRVDIAVGWFLDSVAPQAASNYAVFGTEGVADDLEVAAILDEADDLAARRTLQLVGLDDEDPLSRAQVRAYGGLAKATAREWARRGELTREQAHRLLRDTLLFLVDEVLPR
jgi:AcrR family transcriptional regulator